MTQRTDGGDAILEALRSLGVDYIISSPGSEWPSVWEALARQQIDGTPGPRYLNCGHETLAVAMAIGYTQYTGRMQAVLLHAGLGVLQGAMPIAGAYNGEIPMLLASGESTTYGDRVDFDPGGQWYRGLSVVGGPGRWVDSFTKWSGRVTSSETIYATVTRAGELARRVPRGPTFLSVPMEVMIDPWEPPERPRPVPKAPKVHPDPAAVREVADLIARAENPFILTETGGQYPENFNALVRLAEVGAIPVVEALTALYGNFPRDHPLHMGYDITPFLDESDLVLVISNKVPWYPPAAGPKDATVVVIDENPIKGQMEYQNLQADLYLEGDTAISLVMLADALPTPGPEIAARRQRWKAEHDEQRSGLSAAVDADAGGTPMTTTFAAGTVSAALPPNAIMVDETIVHRLPLLRHGRWNLSQSYFRSTGGLGKGIGQALGIKLAAPDRPVVISIGDGSLLYNPFVPSIGAALEHDLPILIIVFNNRSYASMKGMHLKFYPEGISAESGVHVGVHIPGPDYAAVMRALGGHGERVESPDRLRLAIGEALEHVEDGQPALLDVIVAS